MAQILYTEEDIKTILKCNLYIFSKSEKVFIIFLQLLSNKMILWSQFMINASARMFVKLNFKFPCARKFMARYFPRRFQLNLQAKFIVLHVHEAIQYRNLFTWLADVRNTITKDNVCCRKENKRSEDKWKSHDWIERKTQTVFLCNLLGVQTRSCKKCCSRRDLTWSD